MPFDFFGQIASQGLDSNRPIIARRGFEAYSDLPQSIPPILIPNTAQPLYSPIPGALDSYNGKLYFSDSSGFRSKVVPESTLYNYALTSLSNLIDYVGIWYTLAGFSTASYGAGFYRVTIKLKFTVTNNVTVDLKLVNQSDVPLTHIKDYVSSNIETTSNLTTGTTEIVLLDNEIIDVANAANIMFRCSASVFTSPSYLQYSLEKVDHLRIEGNLPISPSGI